MGFPLIAKTKTDSQSLALKSIRSSQLYRDWPQRGALWDTPPPIWNWTRQLSLSYAD